MTILQIKVVMGTVYICRYHSSKLAAMALVVTPVEIMTQRLVCNAKCCCFLIASLVRVYIIILFCHFLAVDF